MNLCYRPEVLTASQIPEILAPPDEHEQEVDMAAYFLVEILGISDPQQYGRYVKAVPAIVKKYGGEYVLRSSSVSPFIGGSAPQRVILIRFKNRQALEACFGSAEYKQIAPLRESSTQSRAVIVEE